MSFLRFILISRNNVALYNIGNSKEIVDKSIFFVTYYLTHVLESLPAYVKQVCLIHVIYR